MTKISSTERRNTINGLLFTMPSIIGLLVFMVYPIAISIYYSFCNYSGLKPPTWIGLANYKQMTHDPLIVKSIMNTLIYAIGSVPLGIAVAFFLALLLNQRVKGLAFFRTIFYLPSIVPIVASSVLWMWVMNPQYGILNGLLRLAHISGPGWMSDPLWAKPALVLMSTWGVGSSMIIFLAGLQDVPQELYEAAELDGASSFSRMRHITLPFMSPHIFFIFVMGVIGSFQYFTQAYVMTSGTGAPANSTLFYAMYLFQNAFHFFKMGYACAMAWLLFLVVLAATIIIFKTSSKHIYYQGGS